MKLVKLNNPFYKIKENDVIINKIITKEVLDKNEISNTILDERLENGHGFIKLKTGMILYNYYAAKSKIKTLKLKNVNPIYILKKCETYKTKNNDYIKIPKGINKIYKLENGLKILTNLQRVYNNLLIENNIIRSKNENIIYQNMYTDILIEFNNLLSSKGGLYDRSVTSIWPCSVRATVTNLPTLKINEICLPYKVLMSWISKEEVRHAFSIDQSLSNKEAVRFLEGKRIIGFRQPVHDCSNVMSFIIKIKYNNNYVIKVNPAIHHLADSDVDGDQWTTIMPLSKQSQYDLIKMDAWFFIKNNQEHFHPGKEFKKYKPKEWDYCNYYNFDLQISQVFKKSTNGQSLSYHDCLDDKLTDNYLDNLNIDKNELKKITNGIYEDKLLSNDNQVNIKGAIQSYKIIKQNVAQFGALTNAFVALAIHNTWDMEYENKLKYLNTITEFKHILCQDGLSAKHGGNKLNTDNGKILQNMFYRTPDNKIETKEEYINILKDIDMSDNIIKIVIELFWREPLVGINSILNEIVPTYRITRRGSNIGLLDKMIEQHNEKSIQNMMIKEQQ